MENKIKTLLIDIETFPNECYTWGLWDQNIPIEMIKKSGAIACWAAGWAGGKQVFYDSVHQSGYADMLQGIYDLMNEAEAVVTYNGDKFDLPWLRGEFLKVGFTPPAPARSIDLLKTVKSQFRFPSNKLQYVSQALGLGKKLDHEGFPLWEKCMRGEAKAWRTMEEYNIQDVLLLEKLLNKLSGYVKNYPNQSVISGELKCPKCGSKHYQSRGEYVTLAGTYARFQCAAKGCGKWFRSNQNNAAGKDKFIPL